MKAKLSLRGRQFVGVVVSAKAQKTVTVEWPRMYYISKYERYEKRRTRVHAHVPEGFMVVLGSRVKIVETRPISKTKNFVVVEVMK